MIFKCKYLCICMFLLFLGILTAGIEQIEIKTRETIEYKNNVGKSISYEIVKGTLYLTIDPKAELNRKIIDLKYANTNQYGLVQYGTVFELHYPSENQEVRNGTIQITPIN